MVVRSNEAGNLYRHGIQLPQKENEAGGISADYGRDHSIREDDEVVYGDSGCLGIQRRPEVTGDEPLSGIDYRINRRPGKLPRVSDKAIGRGRYIENRRSSVRRKAEHAFRIIKCQFGCKKTVYRGPAKNENRRYALFACANLYSLAIAGRKLSTD